MLLNQRNGKRKNAHDSNKSIEDILQDKEPVDVTENTGITNANPEDGKESTNGNTEETDKMWTLDDLRADIVKHPDNLKPEGEFTKRGENAWKPGERAPIIKRYDNLKIGGAFEDQSPKVWLKGEGVENVKESIMLCCFTYCLT